MLDIIGGLQNPYTSYVNPPLPPDIVEDDPSSGGIQKKRSDIHFKISQYVDVTFKCFIFKHQLPM